MAIDWVMTVENEFSFNIWRKDVACVNFVEQEGFITNNNNCAVLFKFKNQLLMT